MKNWRTIIVAAFVVALTGAGAAAATAATRLVDVSRQAGVYDARVHTWSAEQGDVNSDGWDDAIVVNHYEGPAFLYVNNRNGTFERQRFGTKRDRHECAFGDVNNDGREDFYCSVGGGKGAGVNANELWIQGPGGGFENLARRYGVADEYGRGRDVAFFDANRDGLVDLYVGNHFPRTDGRRSTNKLFLNVDGTRFRRAPNSWRLNREVGGRILEPVDFNRDGFVDLFVCGTDRAFLFQNLRGRRFKDVSRRANLNKPCESGVVARMNGGRRQDIVLATDSRLKVLLQNSRGRFVQRATERIRGGTELAAGRVDGNNREDIYLVQRGRPNSDTPDRLLLNRRNGRRLRDVRIPQTRRGKGDYVISLDYDRNGRSDFLVLNGFHKHPGPVRLLATRR